MAKSHIPHINHTNMTASGTATRSNHAEVEQVRNILLTRVPYELVDIIIAEAQYWTRLSTKRDAILCVKAVQESLHNAKWCYMISEPVPTQYNGESTVPTRVKSVRFSLRSCDQGWGGFSEGKNTYRNSYTWFEASILRPPARSSSPSPSPPDWVTSTMFQGPTNLGHHPSLPSESQSGWTEIHSPHKTKNRRWLVQMNAQASRHIRRHDVTWSTTSTSNTAVSRRGEGMADATEYDEKTGSGRGLGFVDCLQAGDRIAFVARALFPGWENNVYETEIEIAY
ncbi:hypothetical protein P691DRAFT_775679 [Macrolepiota fuliginosa MF-IS2]|uniref:Uncharacterized protein n=1 Tax=Macrolepiota fuliginosa MF-IS2 TaxID=1400762 RepID=A0A9P5XDY9_9AGAR|nr:hypothetical protein P691DRAFT_775679 [Macrolepiota fuliginosa MF-IS2]